MVNGILPAQTGQEEKKPQFLIRLLTKYLGFRLYVSNHQICFLLG